MGNAYKLYLIKFYKFPHSLAQINVLIFHLEVMAIALVLVTKNVQDCASRSARKHKKTSKLKFSWALAQMVT